MNLIQLRTFLAVVDAGSITAAAQELGCAQSTASFHLSGLEEALGKQLVQRSSRSLRLTDAGTRLLPRARSLVALVEETRREVAGAESLAPVRVEASTIPATYLLPPILARLRRSAPDLHVRVRVSDSQGAIRAVAEGRCDVAVVGSPPTDRRLTSQVFAQDRIVLVGLPDAGPPTDLAEVPLVLREPGSGTRAAAERLIPPGGPRLEMGSTEAVRRCVLAGLGFGLISDRAVRDDLEQGRLRRFPLAGLPVDRAFHVVRLRGVRPGLGAQRLWSALGE